MHPINWIIIVVYLSYFVVDGVRRARGTHALEGYFLANRSLPWWAVGLSVMATQLSAITMIGTTGQGATAGLGLIQLYFGLPLAMIILGVTLVPLLRGAGIFTAYEFLEKRFNPATRSLTSFLFLCSRGMSCGVIVAAPAVVFSAIFGWDLVTAVAIIGVPTVLYTMVGGVQAVTWTDVKQMVLIVIALVAIVFVLFAQLPVAPGDAMRVAGAAGRLKAFDFSFDVTNQFTFWSGLIGGLFLMLSYFGTDQSQVQRYLTARSIPEARTSLMMSAYWKIPLQALVLLVGVLVFVFYLFNAPPLLFNPAHENAVRTDAGEEYAILEGRFAEAWSARQSAAWELARGEAADDATVGAFRGREDDVTAVRGEAMALASRVTGQPARDVNYIIPHFVLNYLPLGLAGIFIAAIMAAAMSSISSELASLSTVTVIDFYRRWLRPQASDTHYLVVSRLATGFWGLFACFIATYAATLGSLIEVVNRFGSFFYGSILGVFLLAMIPFARPWAAFFGLIAGMAAVAGVSFYAPAVAFLWLNVVGAGAVVILGVLLSLIGAGGLPRAAGGGARHERQPQHG
jgi:solute:Na+ symporter, SSS family